MDNHLQIIESLTWSKMEKFLVSEGFVRVRLTGVPCKRAYVTKSLADDDILRRKFFETRHNMPKSFGKPLMIIGMEGGFLTDDGESTEIQTIDGTVFEKEALFNDDLKACEANEFILSGRVSRVIDEFLRRMIHAGISARSTFLHQPRTAFPFPYYQLMNIYRSTGMHTNIQMLSLCCNILEQIQSPENKLNLALFNKINGSLLYAIEFGAAVVKTSTDYRDDYYVNTFEMFLKACVIWIKWLSGYSNPQVPMKTIDRWTVSALDILVPLVLMNEIDLKGHLSPEHIESLQLALKQIDAKKKFAASSAHVLNNVERVSQFKWQRSSRIIQAHICHDIDKLQPTQCEPILARFLPAFEEIISSPLEQALAPLHFQLVAKIYVGPSAVMYKCVDLNTGSYIACKQFYCRERSPFGNSNSESEEQPIESLSLKEALKETGMLKIVQGHQNVVKYLNESWESPYFFLFTEYYSGGTLSGNKVLCKRDPTKQETDLVWKARFKVLQQVKEAIVYIHDIGVIHDDIKSSNVLFDALGQVKLCDFGSAMYDPKDPRKAVPLCLEDMTKVTNDRFTIPYMAPELLAKSIPTKATDIWAFGCLALELVTGIPPWHGLGPGEIFTRLSQGETPLNHVMNRMTGVPIVFKKVIENCLVTDPAKRFTARQLLELHYILYDRR